MCQSVGRFINSSADNYRLYGFVELKIKRVDLVKIEGKLGPYEYNSAGKVFKGGKERKKNKENRTKSSITGGDEGKSNKDA